MRSASSLSQAKEPQIWNAIRFGTVLEDVAINSDLRKLDLDLNNRARISSRPVQSSNADDPGVTQPSNAHFIPQGPLRLILYLQRARFKPEQTMYHLLKGYTAWAAIRRIPEMVGNDLVIADSAFSQTNACRNVLSAGSCG
jgi:phosphoenolpyruvate carboxykinase (ATP)